MTIQTSTAVENARLDIIEATIGPNAILRIRTGAQPANTAANRSGIVLSTVQLPIDWMQAAAGRAKSMLGSWADNSADAAGTAGHWEITDATGTVVGLQGTVSATGGGGDMELNNVIFAAGQPFSITTFTLLGNNQ